MGARRMVIYLRAASCRSSASVPARLWPIPLRILAEPILELEVGDALVEHQLLAVGEAFGAPFKRCLFLGGLQAALFRLRFEFVLILPRGLHFQHAARPISSDQ
jgi:hypothetical protein